MTSFKVVLLVLVPNDFKSVEIFRSFSQQSVAAEVEDWMDKRELTWLYSELSTLVKHQQTTLKDFNFHRNSKFSLSVEYSEKVPAATILTQKCFGTNCGQL